MPSILLKSFFSLFVLIGLTPLAYASCDNLNVENVDEHIADLLDGNGGKRIGVFIGADYTEDSPQVFTPLSNAVNDAGDMSKKFSEWGFSTICLENPDQRVLLTFLDALDDAAPENGLLVMYLAGHGFSAGPENYFIPAMAPSRKFNLLVKYAISARSITQFMQNEERSFVLLLDSCRNPISFSRDGHRDLNQSSGFTTGGPSSRGVLKHFAAGDNGYAHDMPEMPNGLYASIFLTTQSSPNLTVQSFLNDVGKRAADEGVTVGENQRFQTPVIVAHPGDWNSLSFTPSQSIAADILNLIKATYDKYERGLLGKAERCLMAKRLENLMEGVITLTPGHDEMIGEMKLYLEELADGCSEVSLSANALMLDSTSPLVLAVQDNASSDAVVSRLTEKDRARQTNVVWMNPTGARDKSLDDSVAQLQTFLDAVDTAYLLNEDTKAVSIYEYRLPAFGSIKSDNALIVRETISDEALVFRAPSKFDLQDALSDIGQDGRAPG